MNTLVLSLTALGGLCVLFAGVYALARRLDNYGIVDVAWSYAFGLVAVYYAAAADGWLGIIAPLAILYLLLGVTGIPLTEEQAVRSKGDAYRRYQQSTSVFIPWPPRPGASVRVP